mgnify:CR=1 FL=1
MAIGEKYVPLGNWLKEHGGDSVKLTFDELNQIIPIPNHAYKNRPSWANLSNPASFCSSWISAGYVVDSISLEEQWVVFRKGEVQGHTHHSKPPYRVVDQKKLAEAIQAGYECYDSMKDDPHHRYLSWEYCHEAFRLNLDAEYIRICQSYDPTSDEWTVDRYNRRWIMCTVCGRIKQDAQMSYYGGKGGANRGVCADCSRNGRS